LVVDVVMYLGVDLFSARLRLLSLLVDCILVCGVRLLVVKDCRMDMIFVNGVVMLWVIKNVVVVSAIRLISIVMIVMSCMREIVVFSELFWLVVSFVNFLMVVFSEVLVLLFVFWILLMWGSIDFWLVTVVFMKVLMLFMYVV